jgi:hypothetical protein
MSGVLTQPLYAEDPMDVVVHKVQFRGPWGSGQVNEFDHPRDDSTNFVNVDVHTEPDTTIRTFTTGGNIALSLDCDNGSGVTIWFPVGRAEELALAVLAKAAEAKAGEQS